MAYPNLRLRGGTYSWRRKITVGGITIPLSISLKTGNFSKARAIAARLAAEIEILRMSYGERGVSVDAETLKKVFGDALRWQLERITSDQAGSAADVSHHEKANTFYGELWRLCAKRGSNPEWLQEDERRLGMGGWSVDTRTEFKRFLARAIDGETTISKLQTDAYLDKFNVEPTSENLDRMRRVIYAARAQACDEATRRLGEDPADYRHWVEEALDARAPLVFESAGSAALHPVVPDSENRDRPLQPDLASIIAGAPDGASRQKLTAAAEECINAYRRAKSWGTDTADQVRTAIRLLDFAAGGDVDVEDLVQKNVTALKTLCEKLPNRWGRTREEIAGGLAASVKRATGMDQSKVGMNQKTIRKHVTWISSVLSYSATDAGGNHKTAEALSFNEIRKGLGKGSKRERARNLRAAWSRKEIDRLLDAPVWSGCADLDDRFSPGNEIWHDGWYWLPLMFILYGGRSAEMTALPLSEIHENEAIPYFRINYSELRTLKTAQSVRSLPIHPELIRLGFIEYIGAVRSAGHALLFPEMHSEKSASFASTTYKSIFQHWRAWAFPEGTAWRHQVGGAMKDKDVQSFRGSASTLMKGRVPDSVRIDILGHEGENVTTRVYDEEAGLDLKLDALKWLTPLTAKMAASPLNLRPPDRMVFGSRGRGRRKS